MEIEEMIEKYKNIEKTNGYDPMESEFERGESAGESRVEVYQMKKCPICKEVFCEFDDVVKIKEKTYHEECIEIMPVRYCAYIPGDYEDGFLGEFEEDDKTFASMVLKDEEYKKEKRYAVTYVNQLNKLDRTKVFATDEEDAKSKISDFLHLKVLTAEELQEVDDSESEAN